MSRPEDDAVDERLIHLASNPEVLLWFIENNPEGQRVFAGSDGEAAKHRLIEAARERKRALAAKETTDG